MLSVGESRSGCVDALDFFPHLLLYFLHYLHFLLCLQTLSLLVEDLHLLDLMVCNFELVLNMSVLVPKFFSFLEHLLSFYLVLLLADLIADPALLSTQQLDLGIHLSELVLLDLQFFLELHLGVEQLVSKSLQAHAVVLSVLPDILMIFFQSLYLAEDIL